MQQPVIAHPEPRRLTRAEYHRMGECGFFAGERVELIRGMVIRHPPIAPSHANPVDVLTERLVQALAGRARVRIQQPLLAVDESEPEPDVAVVPLGNYGVTHPDRAHLVIEVAASSLVYDRETKAPLYAASNVDEYWIVDVGARVVTVFRDAVDGAWRTRSRAEITEDIALLAFPDVVIAVRDLFA